MKYSVKALIVYLLAMVLLAILNETVAFELNAVHISFLGLFMYATSMLVHHFIMKASGEEPKRFPAYFMAITGLKMMIYIVALGIYVFLFKESGIPVVVAFLVLYVVYTVLEVSSVLRALK